MRILLVCLMLIAPLSGFARAGGGFIVNDTQVSNRVFDKLWQAANEQDGISKKAFKQQLVDALLLREYALAQKPELEKATNVGYDPKLTQALHVNRLLVKWFEFDSKAKQQAVADYLDIALNKAQLEKAIGKASILGYSLDAKQRAKAQAVEVAYFHIPGQGPVTLNLAQLYDSQSVQGRIPYHQADLNVVVQHIHDRFFIKWHRHAALARKDFDEPDLQALDRIVQAKFLEPLLMLELGAMTSEHGDNEAIKPFVASVSEAEVAKFYQANKADFAYISQAKALVLVFEDHETAAKQSKGLDSESDWLASAQKLGQKALVDSRDSKDIWLTNLMFSLPVDQDNPPVRNPKGQFVLLKVLEKHKAYYPVDSETVVYQARNAVGKAKAAKAFKRLKQNLLAAAKVRDHE